MVRRADWGRNRVASVAAGAKNPDQLVWLALIMASAEQVALHPNLDRK